ncbi:MAG: hypothetical protein GTN93_27950, partial [Anaerolineae bacterium]|nr:hypothetical protein [Anaerolineae bacterium]
MSDYKALLHEDTRSEPTFVVRLDEGHIPDFLEVEGETWEASFGENGPDGEVIYYLVEDDRDIFV